MTRNISGKLLVVTALCGLFAGAGSALAQRATPPSGQELGFYAGAALGQAKAQDFCDTIIGGGFTGGCDDKDTAWKIFGGYQFHRNIAVELGYVDMGEITASGTRLGLPASGSAEVTGIEFVALGIIPFTPQFSGFVKAGGFRWDVDTSTAGAAEPRGSDDGVDFTYGLGVRYDFTRNLAARLEFQRYNNVGETNTTGQSDVNLWAIGLMYKF